MPLTGSSPFAKDLLNDVGDTVTADAAIIFSAQAVEHCEIIRYRLICGFAEALGLEDSRDHVDAILEQEKATDKKLSTLAEESVDDAAEGPGGRVLPVRA